MLFCNKQAKKWNKKINTWSKWLKIIKHLVWSHKWKWSLFSNFLKIKKKIICIKVREIIYLLLWHLISLLKTIFLCATVFYYYPLYAVDFVLKICCCFFHSLSYGKDSCIISKCANFIFSISRISWVYSKYNTGLRILPCGTPANNSLSW